MERLLSILAIVALVSGALVAILLSGPFVLAGLGIFGLAVTVFVFLTRQLVPALLGALAALLLIVAIIGGIGGVTISDTGADAAAIDLPVATASLIAGLALAAGAVLAARWTDFDPDWVGFVGAGSLALAAILAFVFMERMGGLGVWAFVVGLLMLIAVWPTLLLLRAVPGEVESAPRATGEE